MFKQTFWKLKQIPLYDDFLYNQKINFIIKFTSLNIYNLKTCNKIILNFGFKQFNFEKKNFILHFFILELLSNQKCIITFSTKNNISLKIKKGSITGCKVTLKNKNLFLFFETLFLSLPRSEIFKKFPFNLKTQNQNTFSIKLKEFFIFYNLAFENLTTITVLDLSFLFNTKSNFEKAFYLTHNKIPLKLFM